MVSDRKPDDIACFADTTCKQAILGTGCRITAGMGMKNNCSCRSPSQSLGEDRPRIDRSSAKRSTEELARFDQSIPSIEEDGTHHFLVADDVFQNEIAGYLGRAPERLSVSILAHGEPLCELVSGKDCGRAPPRNSLYVEGVGPSSDQLVETTVTL